jgi:hypothetical protein
MPQQVTSCGRSHEVHLSLDGFDQPPLGVVILCRPGDESEVLPLNFMGIHISAIDLLLDGIRIVGRGC